MQTYHFHRFIGENEDPLGSQEGMTDGLRDTTRDFLQLLFSMELSAKLVVPDGDSLQDDYNQNLAKSIDLGVGSSTLGLDYLMIPIPGNLESSC